MIRRETQFEMPFRVTIRQSVESLKSSLKLDTIAGRGIGAHS